MMKKVKFVGLALLLAFALMGAAFAAWSDTLTVNATVNTGELDADLSVGTVSDNEEDLDVASVNAVVSPDGKTLTITLSNAYPGYEATVPFTVINDGTIPVNVSGLTLSGDANVDIDVTFVGATNLAPDDAVTGTITLTVTGDAAENDRYTFSGTISVTQFNQ